MYSQTKPLPLDEKTWRFQVCRRLLGARFAQNLSNDRAAAKLGIPAKDLWNYEGGHIPDPLLFSHMVCIYQCDASWVLGLPMHDVYCQQQYEASPHSNDEIRSSLLIMRCKRKVPARRIIDEVGVDVYGIEDLGKPFSLRDVYLLCFTLNAPADEALGLTKREKRSVSPRTHGKARNHGSCDARNGRNEVATGTAAPTGRIRTTNRPLGKENSKKPSRSSKTKRTKTNRKSPLQENTEHEGAKPPTSNGVPGTRDKRYIYPSEHVGTTVPMTNAMNRMRYTADRTFHFIPSNDASESSIELAERIFDSDQLPEYVHYSSDWDRALILAEVRTWCKNNKIRFDTKICKLTQSELRSKFLVKCGTKKDLFSGWHYKYLGSHKYMTLDGEALRRYFEGTK